MSDGGAVGPGWHRDPWGRFEHRWWDGQQWTAHVWSQGRAALDTPGGAVPPAPDPAWGGTPPPPSSRRPVVIAVVAVAVVLALIVVVTNRDDGSDGLASISRGGSTAERSDTLPDRTINSGTGTTGAGETTTLAASAVIGPTGGTVAVPDDHPSAPGVKLSVSEQSLDRDEEVRIGVGPVPTGKVSGMATADPSLWDAIADWAIASEDDPLAHPVYGPLIAAAADPAGPLLSFEPDGLTFAAPAELSVPIADLDLPDGTSPVVLVESAGGWEVVQGVVVDTAAGVVRIPVVHFSNLSIWRILGNAFWNPAATVPRDVYRQALQTLGNGPIADVELGLRRALLCDQRATFDASKAPDLNTALNYLGFESTRISQAPAGAKDAIQAELQRRFDASVAAGVREPHNVTLGELVGFARDQVGGDLFQALVLAHDVLRDNRDRPFVQNVMENVRGDGGDEKGARYHLLGVAVYSFMYQHAKATGTAPFYIPSPTTAVALEEAWVSGDIRTDAVEYAVDRRGAAFGRILYQDYQTIAAGQGDDIRSRLCDDTTTTTTGQPVSSTAVPETTGVSLTVPTDVVLGTGDFQATLLWETDADMDLHVIDPSGAEIFFDSSSSPSGGTLDQDDVPSCGDNRTHVENIFWPTGATPPGTYTVFVVYFAPCSDPGSSTPVQVTIAVDGIPVEQHTYTIPVNGESERISFPV
jgi:hypothetical protein